MKLKRVALIGSPGLELTAHYSRLIGEEVRHRFGGTRQANVVTLTFQDENLTSLEPFGDPLQNSKKLTEVGGLLRLLGTEGVVVCSSVLQSELWTQASLPVISMCAPVARALQKSRLRRVGLLGTRTADEERAWQTALLEAGIQDVLLPVPRDREYLAGIVDGDFANGLVTSAARADVLRVVHSLRQAGARAVVVGMPELTAILQDEVPVLPVFDVAELHVVAAVDWMMIGSNP